MVTCKDAKVVNETTNDMTLSNFNIRLRETIECDSVFCCTCSLVALESQILLLQFLAKLLIGCSTYWSAGDFQDFRDGRILVGSRIPTLLASRIILAA